MLASALKRESLSSFKQLSELQIGAGVKRAGASRTVGDAGWTDVDEL